MGITQGGRKMQEQVNPSHEQNNNQQNAQQDNKTNQLKKKPEHQKKSGQSKVNAKSQVSGNGSGKPSIQAKQRPVKSKHSPVQAKHNPVNKSHPSDLPPKLAHNVEQMTGVNMEGTKVIQNSSLPGKHHAEALAVDGKEIHLSRGNQKHLPEEAAHIARQRQGNLAPDTKMLAHGWRLNTNQAIEKEDRALGAKANAMTYMPANYERKALQNPLQSSVMQRNPGKFDVLENLEARDLGMEALKALLYERKKDIGAAIVDNMLKISLEAGDALAAAYIETQMKTEGSMLSKVSNAVKAASTKLLKLGTYYNTVIAGKDTYESLKLPIVFIKYGIGRGIIGLGKMFHLSIPHTILNKIMNVETPIVDLINWVEAIVNRITNFLGYFTRFKKMFDEDPELRKQYSNKPVSTAFHAFWNNGGSKAVGAEGKSFGDWVMNSSGTVDTIGSVSIGTGLLISTTGVGLWGLSKVTKSMDSKTGGLLMATGAVLVLGGMAVKGAYNWYYGSEPQKEKQGKETNNKQDEEQQSSKEKTQPVPDSSMDKQQLPNGDEQQKKKPLQSINTKYFWMELYKADISEWEKTETDQNQKKTTKKTGGAQIDFGMGFNLFGRSLAASKGHQVKLDWDGGFDYQNSEGISLSDKPIGYENAFQIGNASIDEIHVNNKGLQKLDLSLTSIDIAGGAVTAKKISASWSKDAGFKFSTKDKEGAGVKANIAGHSIEGDVEFGMDNNGKFTEGKFSIENLTGKGKDKDKGIDLIPGTLSITASKFEMAIDANKKLSGTAVGAAKMTSDYIHFNSGKVTVSYDEGWSIKAPKIGGKVLLPGQAQGNAIEVNASVDYEKKKFKGDMKATTTGALDIVPEVLSLKSFEFEGSLDQTLGKWDMKVAGAVSTQTNFLDLDTGVVTFTYKKGTPWTLEAPDIKGKVKLPGGKTIDVGVSFSIVDKQIAGELTVGSVDSFEVIPNTLSIANVSVTGKVNQKNKTWGITVGGKANLDSSVVKLDTGQIDFKYDSESKIWKLDAPKIAGSIELPNGKTIKAKAAVRLTNGKYDGELTATLPEKIEAIPQNLLNVKDLGFKGKLNNDHWAISLWGGFDLNSQFLTVDAKKIQFDYEKGGKWGLEAKDIGITLALMGKTFKGKSSFALANKKVSGSLDIATEDTFDIIPGVLQIQGGKFAGSLSEDKQIKARLQSTLATPDNQYLTVVASNAFLEYDSAKGDTFAQAWTVGIESLKAGIFNNSVTLEFAGAQFSLQDKKLVIPKVTLGYKKGGSEELPETSGGFDWGNLGKILDIMQKFEVQASLEDITIDSKGFHFGNKKPDWSLKELQMEYGGFMLNLTINDTEVSGTLGGAYKKDFDIFSLEMGIPIPGLYVINLVGGINLVAKVDASAQMKVAYDKKRSTQEDAFLKLSGGGQIGGGLYLEAVLGASVGQENIISLGGQLYGRFGADLTSKINGGATLQYNKATRKVSQGPNNEDKFRMRVDSEFSPTLELGGRLVFKLLGKKFNLFEYQFGKWNFGEGRMAFDMAPDEKGRYQITPDKEVTHFNNKKFLQSNDISKAINGIPESSTIKKEYDEFRDLFDNAEKADSPQNRQRLVEELQEDGPVVKERMFELMKMLVTRKEEINDGLKLLDDDDSGLSFFEGLKERYREHKKEKELKSELENVDEELKELTKEIKKVLLVNRNPKAAVELLEKQRDKWTNIFNIKKFGIWDDLPKFLAQKEFEGLNHQMGKQELEKVIQQRSVEIKKAAEAEIGYRYELILQEIKQQKVKIKEEVQGPRGVRKPQD